MDASNGKKVFCVIPAFNEERNIAEVLQGVVPLVTEAVVVDDGSSDRTSEIAEMAGAAVLRHPVNRGQGAALQTGIDYALEKGADIVVHFDADGQFLPEEIKDLVRPIIEEGYDIVYGSRFLGKKSEMPFIKEKFLMPAGRLFNILLMGKTLSDPQSGFRAMNRTSAGEMRIENDGFAHASELMKKAVTGGYKLKEVPITVIYKRFGLSLSGGIKIIKDLLISKLLK